MPFTLNESFLPLKNLHKHYDKNLITPFNLIPIQKEIDQNDEVPWF